MSFPWLGYRRFWTTFLGKAFLGGVLLLPGLHHEQAIAQVIPDLTLPTFTSVRSEGNTFYLEAGTEIGNNLFHSFESFSLPTGSAAIFTVSPSIETVLSRVTGSSMSNIDGLIQVNGAANFFLINPNGVVFGPNASLDVGGSFLATTADHIKFDEGIFSATEFNSAPLLSLTTPIGLQFGQNSGGIVNLSRTVNAAGESTGLQVQPNQTIALIGGAIDIPGGQIISPQSHIALGSVAGESLVGITPQPGQGLTINYYEVEAYQDIQISQLARVDSSGSSGGLLQLQGRKIIVEGGSQVFSKSLSGDDAGKGINVNASDALEVVGTGPSNGERDATIRDFFRVFNAQRSSLSTNNFGNGQGGSIDVRAKRVSVRDGGDISARTLGSGKGGNIVIKDSEFVEVSGDTENFGSTDLLKDILEGSPIPVSLAEGAASASFIVANSFGAGKGGDVIIETHRLLVRDGAFVSANPFGSGNGGDIKITATEAVELLGVSESESYSAGISIGPVLSTGKPGMLLVNSPILRITGGAGIGLSTSNSSAALGIFNISDLVEITGTSPNQRWDSSISAESVQNGKGGSVRLTTNALLLADHGTITATGDNASQGGNINIVANSVVIDNHSSITTSVEGIVEGKTRVIGGDIDLAIKDVLLLRRNSGISAKSGEGGSGGNIDIDAGFIVAVTNEDSDIIADAVRGQGGEINLLTSGILGFEVRDLPTPESNDISASSELGLDGTVTIDAPDIDLNPGDIELNDRIEVPRLAQGCLAALSDENSRFVQTGRGGLPVNPASPVSADGLWQDLEPLSSLSLQHKQVALSPVHLRTPDPLPVKSTLKEAIDWQLDSNGEVSLIAPEEASVLKLSTALTCTSN